MDKQPNFVKGMDKIYNKVGYFDKYGGSFVITLLTLMSFTLVFTYFWVNSQIKPIKADWDNKKCHPAVIPFAGYINARPGTSKFAYTAENFNSCMYNILSNIVARFTRPVFSLSETVTNVFKMLVDMVNAIRGIIDYIRTKVMAMIMEILQRFINAIAPLQILVIKMKSLLGKVSGTLVAALYTAIGSYYALKAFIGSLLKLIILALVVLAAVVIVLWIFPWTWALAYVGTAAYIAIAIPTIIIAVWVGRILDISSGKPEACCCFDENTLIDLKDKRIKIKNVKIGDVLKDGSKVTSKLEIVNKNRIMYNVDGIIVSGTHFIYDNYNGWVNVCDYANAVEQVNYTNDVIYCINTSNKIINIGSHVFLDWDDITSLDLVKLKNSNYLNKNDTMYNIHKKLEGGFIGETKLELEDGNTVSIKDICLNDILKYGEVVLAKVEIDASDIVNIYSYEYDGINFCGIDLLIKEGKKIKTKRYFKKNQIENREKLYHIVTDKGLFYVNGLTFLDYNGNLEQVLDVFENKKKSF